MVSPCGRERCIAVRKPASGADFQCSPVHRGHPGGVPSERERSVSGDAVFADAIPDVRIAYSLTDTGATLAALEAQVSAHVPVATSALLGAGDELSPEGRTLPGTDLDSRGVVVRRGTHALARGLGRGAFLEVHARTGLSAHERELLERAEDLGAECS